MRFKVPTGRPASTTACADRSSSTTPTSRTSSCCVPTATRPITSPWSSTTSTWSITHVVRGDDHISNTPKQVLLYQAFGSATPRFAHVPLILGPDKKRLSKRHGATSVIEYQRLGYLPEAMVNFLALLGWSPGGDQELFTREELIAAFALEGISGGNAVFNPEKLDWFNQQHIARLSSSDLAARVRPLLVEAGLWHSSFDGDLREWFLRVIDLLKPRAKKLGQFVEDGRPFFDEIVTFDETAVQKHLGVAGMRGHLRELASRFAEARPFDQRSLELQLRSVAEARGLKPACTHPRDTCRGHRQQRKSRSLRRARTARSGPRLRAARPCNCDSCRVRTYTVCASTVTRTLLLPPRLSVEILSFLGIFAGPPRGTAVAQSCSTVTNEYKGVDVAKEDRGFASMDRSKQKEIASKGGKAAHQKGTAHEWTSDEARDAGRKGGLASHRRRREQKDAGDIQQMVGLESGILSSRAVEQAG